MGRPAASVMRVMSWASAMQEQKFCGRRAPEGPSGTRRSRAFRTQHGAERRDRPPCRKRAERAELRGELRGFRHEPAVEVAQGRRKVYRVPTRARRGCTRLDRAEGPLNPREDHCVVSPFTAQRKGTVDGAHHTKARWNVHILATIEATRLSHEASETWERFGKF